MYKYLKRARVVVSLLVLLLITASFIYLVNRETSFYSQFLKLQFIPSLLGVFSGGLVFFLILIVLTLLFGRVYCSTLCPLGTFQDIVIRVSAWFKSKKGRRFYFSRPIAYVRYLILGVTGGFFILGITLPLGYLDPYSNWGRISNELLSRSEQLIHNGFAYLLPETVFFRSYAQFTTGSFVFAFIIFALVVMISAFRGRLYCNTICPVGTVLGLISRFSLFKPAINRSGCNGCRLCALKCKAECIDLEHCTIDASRCVACLDCMSVCKNGGISYVFSYGKKKNNCIIKEKSSVTASSKGENNLCSPEPVSKERRKALIAMGLMGTALAAKAVNLPPLFSSKPKITGIAPPGAVSVEHFKKNCTACYACVSACPNNIIKPSVGEYGADGMLLPVLSFENHFCSYECNECSLVCPNNAIMPLSLEQKQLTQVGQANFFKDRCIVHTDKTDCGACDEHCPTKAITMIPYGDAGLYIPSMNTNLCIGCGACEYICPAIPDKAMIVYALDVQGKAKKPTVDEQEEIVVDDFGF